MKLISGIKNGIKVTMNHQNWLGILLMRLILLLTDTQVSKIPRAFVNGSSANTKLCYLRWYN